MRALLALVAMTSIASAQPPSLFAPLAEPNPPQLVRPYHHQTLIADGLAIGLVAASATSGSEGLVLLGLGTYAFGAPLVHMTKGRAGHAVVSFGLRLALPFLGATVGHSIDADTNCNPDWLDCSAPSDGQAAGALVGVAAAIAYDAIFLAEGDDPPEAAPITPTLRATQSGATIGIGGSF